jgi:ribulose-phosphate 3-epimerase
VSDLLDRLLDQGPHLSVGLLAGDQLRLGEELDRLAAAGVWLIHVDVMDGVFCPQHTVGPAFVAAIPDRFVKDVHLMIHEPLGKAAAHVAAGAGIVVCHLESASHPHALLQSLAGSGVIRGLALNPGTPVGAVEPLLDELELLLLLAVNPGWPGQRFLATTEERMGQARRLIGDRRIALAVDGAIKLEHVERLAAQGADVIVTGSAVFQGDDAAGNVARLVAAAARGAARRARPREPSVSMP